MTKMIYYYYLNNKSKQLEYIFNDLQYRFNYIFIYNKLFTNVIVVIYRNRTDRLKKMTRL